MLDYEKLEREQLQGNILDLRRKIDQGRIPEDVDLKVRNFSIKFGLEYELLIDKILRDDLFLLGFIKEPQRQTMHETKAFEYLRTFDWVLEAENLPSGGANALYVMNGQIIKGKDISSKTKGKSIDFRWKSIFNGIEIDCFATHKYTKASGGAQDNQFKDVENFFENASQYVGEDKFFFGILDGEYYQTPYKGFSSKIDYLNNSYRTNRTKISASTINALRPPWE